MPRGRGRMDSARRLTVRRRCVVRVLHDNTGLDRARVYEGGGAIACARVYKYVRVDDLHPLGPFTSTVGTLNRPSSEYRQPPTETPPPQWKQRGNVGRSRSLPAAGIIRSRFCSAQSPSHHLALAPAVSLHATRGAPNCRRGCVQECTSSVRSINTTELSQRSVT